MRTAIRAAPVTVWFEHDNNELVMIASGPVNVYTIPVSFSGTSIVPDRDHILGSAEGCSGESPSCTVEGWLSRFVMKRMTYSVQASTLRLNEGAVTVTLRRG